MTKEDLIKLLKMEEIDPSYLKQCEPKDSDQEFQYNYNIRKLNVKQVNGVIKMCSAFKKYFSSDEYSKLVCKKVVSFSRIHVGALSTNSSYENLCITTFATPCHELPDYLVTTCNEIGDTMIARKQGDSLVAF